MYNYIMLIGYLACEVEVKELSDGRRVSTLVLAVKKPFKNMEGNYESELYYLSLWENLAETAQENLKKGDRLAIKGRLSPRKVTLESKAVITTYDLIAERVFFMGRNDDAPNLEG